MKVLELLRHNYKSSDKSKKKKKKQFNNKNRKTYDLKRHNVVIQSSQSVFFSCFYLKCKENYANTIYI